MRGLCPVALLIAAVVGPPSARAGEGSDSPKGQIQLASGNVVQWDYHFDRNAFADSVDLPNGLVAMTRSGNLLRFDRETRKRSREWFGPSRATCLGVGENGQALVGFEDGRVERLDPSSLALTPLATMPGKPHWIGFKNGERVGIVVVVERWKWFDVADNGLGQHGFPERPGGRVKTGRQEWMPYSEVHDLGSGQSCAIDGRASTVHLDRKQRVWLGFEYGEFGGWCRCVDLSGPRPKVVRGPYDPVGGHGALRDCVLGFAELRDGQVWALGGVMHMAGNIVVDRVDGTKVENLVSLEGALFDDEKRGFGPGKPDSPIQRIVEEARPGSLLGFSESNTIFRTDVTLKFWEKIHELDLRPAWGAPEVGDSYPSVRAVHLREGGLICATTRDGYVLVDREKETRDLVPDQLEVHEIRKIEVTSGGTFFREWGQESLWIFRDGRWSQEPIFPGWDENRDNSGVFVGPDGSVYALEGEGTLRWHQGKKEIVAKGTIWLPGSPFATPDGNLWSVAPSGEEGRPGSMFRVIGGRWQKVADLPELDQPAYAYREYLDGGEMLFGYGWDIRKTRRADGNGFPYPYSGHATIGDNLRVVNESGPNWVIHDLDAQQLLGLDARAELPAPRFVRIPREEAGVPLTVYDAIAWSREDVLIATRKGLKLYEIATGKVRPAPLPSPDRPVKRLTRDGLGRLWLGGEGLWMIDEKSCLHDLAEVPMIGRSEVSAMAADGQRKDGAIVSLGVRGVAFLRVQASP